MKLTEPIAKVTRPILRYHGGKFILADWIISHFPDHTCYTETFGGGASVLLKKKRAYAEVYNDMDGEVVNLFKVARDNGDELRERLMLTPFSRYEFNTSYLKSECNIEQARRTVIRSFMGFGSGIQSHQKTGFRANSNRSGTTPAHDWANLPDAYEAIISRLKGVVIENRDYKEVVKHHDREDTLHFFDPPYVLDTRYKKQKTKVYKYEMTDTDHQDFCRFILGLKGMQVVCGYDNEIYNDILSGYRKITKASFADGARPRIEVLWISPNTPLSQISLFN
jgi:DNA adenine methylase